MPKLTKKQQLFQKQLPPTPLTSVEGVLTFLKKNHFVQFDSSVDAVFSLNVNPKRAEHNLKGTYQLVHPFPLKTKICVFTEAHMETARKFSLHLIGGKALIEQIAQTKKADFDLAIATPEIMPELAQIGRILGPKKLMPSLKTATITSDLAHTIQAFQAGMFTYQIDSGGNLHLRVGKISQSVDKLKVNFYHLLQHVQKIKPPFVKKQYLKQISLSTTMSPGFKLDLQKL